MLGWHISVYRQTNGGASPATAESPEGARLAVWQTGLGGLEWIDELVKAGRAIDLGGNGYPCRYTATAEYLIPRIIDEPPGARIVWTFDEGDIILEGWEGKTVVDRDVIAACRPDEWLLIVAWDES
jgi:hypothetical protein